MDTPFEIIQSIEALGIVIFSLVSIYYGIRILAIHVSMHRKLLSCCWLTVMQTFSQLIFLAIYIFVLWQLLGRGISLLDPLGFGATFLRPAILINNAVVAVYFKMRYINEKNKKKVGEIKNG